jgi:hypothetical protein
MGVLGSNIDRVKNILAGDYTSRTKSGVGYSKTTTDHSEGDIWEENGKKWTIKNGLRQPITRFDIARIENIVPLACPECSKPLTHYLDTRSWKTTKKCFDCVVAEETRMRADGTFDAYSKQLYKENALAWLEEKRQQFELFINDEESLKGFVTENGTIEDWYGKIDKTTIKQKFEEEYKEFKEKIDSL